MKLLGALVGATTLLCITASPLVKDNSDDSTRASGCNFHPNCDGTGEEKIPIPCEGFCDKYFFCRDGKAVMEDCPRSTLFLHQNFNNNNRQCESSFKDCDWWREDKPTTTNPDDPNPTTGTPDPNKPTSETPPNTDSPTISTATEPPCHQDAECDATGTQKKPIACAGYCNHYYLCVEGKVSVQTCPSFQNFDNVRRQCSTSFKNCNWYKELETTTPATDKTTEATGATDAPSTAKPTTSKPNPTTTGKPSRASSLVNSTTSLLLAALIPVLERYL